jgi:hypothetical protein
VNEFDARPSNVCTPTVERSRGSISKAAPISPELSSRPPWKMTLTLLVPFAPPGGNPAPIASSKLMPPS